MNSNPITQGLITDWEITTKKASAYEAVIIARLDYIIRTVFKTFERKLETWYFSDAGEGGMGNFTYDVPEIYMVMETARNRQGGYDNNEDMFIIDKDGGEYGFDGSVPTRWLFEDFEKELVDGKKKFEEKEIERKLKQKELSTAKKQEDKALIEAAKKKLSKKELAAIRRSL